MTHPNYTARTIPHGVTAHLESAMKFEQEALQRFPADSLDRATAQRNIDLLAPALERAKARDAARAEAREQRAADGAAKAQERAQATEAALEERLRLDFLAGNPGASEEDFQRVKPALKDQYMLRKSNEAMAHARSKVRI